ncbi:calpain-9 isoform X2 [Pelobates cultripes]|uniref:Calpain-9 isoform X2 n=1 Tax=Pelobates cultripes TaxID=61616 RepID=A0AAD1T0Z3_PELCU|nr:calpain-9 isoform X2 [Pelobates cultripes]
MFAGQCYQSLRASCLEKGQLFTDPEFSYINSDPDVKWKRPPEFCQNPKFIDSGARSTDICQGQLGDCWLLAAISSLTLHPTLLSRVVPEDQTFCPSGGYCGIFHFKLWRFGEWVDVVVDDKLPTKGGRLLYTKSDTRGEMWSTLLEKAYAKVCGGYSALQGGAIPEALEDFTGGVAESVNVTRQSVEEIWELVNQSEGDKALMGCYIEVSEPSDIGRINDEGLVLGHAYSVIGAKKVQSRLGEVLLLHLRNPWGFTEYKGAWSDRINLDSSCWSVTNLSGRWESGVSAGGGRRLKSFFNNPQFRLHIDEVSSPDQKVDPAQGEETYTSQEEDGIKGRQILLQLLQTDPRRDRFHIACHLYKSLRPRLDRGFFTRSRPVCDTGDPQNSRGVVLRTLVNSGEYVIVPSTHNPNEEGTFLIRVYCEKMGCMKKRQVTKTAVLDKIIVAALAVDCYWDGLWPHNEDVVIA